MDSLGTVEFNLGKVHLFVQEVEGENQLVLSWYDADGNPGDTQYIFPERYRQDKNRVFVVSEVNGHATEVVFLGEFND